MPWINTDNSRMVSLNFRQSLWATISHYFYVYLLNPLADRGFFYTEEGAKFRLRDISLRPWKVLEQRYIKLIENKDERVCHLEERLTCIERRIRQDHAQIAIVVGSIVKAAGGEVKVGHGLYLHRDRLVTYRDDAKCQTIYKVVQEDV